VTSIKSVVVIDTNQIPTQGDFESSFWRSLRHLCGTQNLRLTLPDVIVHESVNKRATDASEWAESFRQSHQKLSSVARLEPIYVPQRAEIADSWRRSLEAVFDVIPVHGDDAIESLKREALRQWPAQKGYGSRDSAIWLTIVRLVFAGTDVHLVTNNSHDFGKGKLRPELQEEVADAAGNIFYHSTKEAFVAGMATRVDVKPSLSEPIAQELLGETARARALDLLDSLEFDAISVDDVLDSEVLFTGLRVFDSFNVDGSGIANIIGRFTLSPPGGPIFASASFNTWLDFDPSTNEFSSSDLGDVHIDFR
jgi:hypothetical protein